MSIGQKTKQSNSSAQSQTAGNDSSQDQSGGDQNDQSNDATQDASENEVGARSPEVVVASNGGEGSSGDVKSGGDALTGKSIAKSGLSIGQKAKQSNSSAQSQTAGDGASQDQSGGDQNDQSNGAEQDASGNAVDAVTSEVAVVRNSGLDSSGDVKAGGDALIAELSTKAGLSIGQKTKQNNHSTMSQTAGDGASQDQSGSGTNDQSNDATQDASGNAVRALSGDVSVNSNNGLGSSGDVTAGGDALIGKSSAASGLYIEQGLKQKNSRTRSQIAGEGATQDQSSGGQTNAAQQQAGFKRDLGRGGGCERCKRQGRR